MHNLSKNLVNFYEDNNKNMSDEIIDKFSFLIDVRFNYNIAIHGKYFDILKFEDFVSHNTEV